MANQKITDLTPITSTQINASNDVLTLVDVSDTTMSTSGTNKKATIIEILKKTTLNLLGDVNISSPTNGQVLTYNGTEWVNGSGNLTVGTTPINNGNVGRVLFEGTGNVLQQSANLFFDDSSYYKLNIGNAALTNSHFQVRAANGNASSNSIAVRDVLDNYYKFKLRNYGTWNFRINNSTMAEDYNACEIMADNANAYITIKGNHTTGEPVFKGHIIYSPQKGYLQYGLFVNNHPYINDTPAMLASNSNKRFLFASDQTEKGWAFAHGNIPIGHNNTVFAIFPTNGINGGGTLALGTTLGTAINTIPTPAHGYNTFYIANGNAPTANVGNAFAMYSADAYGGKLAAPHFRTGDGDVIRLFEHDSTVPASTFAAGTGTPVLENSTFDGYTIGQIVFALRNYGLLQ